MHRLFKLNSERNLMHNNKFNVFGFFLSNALNLLEDLRIELLEKSRI